MLVSHGARQVIIHLFALVAIASVSFLLS
uniref:Uncharacterized protein n=1 Tax=Arundo donax TaxID=35708 RepID=A0A0A9A9K6_ARUDO